MRNIDIDARKTGANRVRLLEAGVAPAVVATMTTHVRRADTMVAGLRLLCNLAYAGACRVALRSDVKDALVRCTVST